MLKENKLKWSNNFLTLIIILLIICFVVLFIGLITGNQLFYNFGLLLFLISLVLSYLILFLLISDFWLEE